MSASNLSARRRTHARIALVSTTALVAFSPLAHAQQAAGATTTDLPEVKVITVAPSAQKPITQKPAAKKAIAKQPQSPPPPQDVAKPIVAEGGNPLANAGTPQAGVQPILGTAGSPGAQTATGIDTQRLQTSPVFSAQDLLRQSPGVSLKQGNGPRDLGISIRGSNARNGFGIRNIVIFDDGFPVTQPDGLSRSDLIDPHAYSGVDVWRGPSSALFGNYATGGAINFRTRPGGEINGVEYGLDAGSFNYWNNYVSAGVKSGAFEGSVFLSDVRGDGIFEYSAFDTQTINLLLSYAPTARDKFTFKAINNELTTELPFRISLRQYLQNPFQEGCRTSGTAAQNAVSGCQAQNFSPTGNTNSNGDRVLQTAEQAGANRDDRRTIIGGRWEHAFSADTSGRVQVVLDDRNISQPTGNTSAVGDFFSYNVSADLTHKASFAGLPASYSAGIFWNYLPIDSLTYNVAPGGNARLGPLQSETDGSTMNFGARMREEVKVAETVTAIAGLSVEKTFLEGTNLAYRYSLAGVVTPVAPVRADRELTNVAPELGLLYQPNAAWQFRGRIGTGYGVPQIGNLFTTTTGDPGNNTDLETQTNVGYDLGADWTPTRGVSLSVTGFYEFFENEFVSQSPAPGRSFTFNVPRSEHRGIEASADIELLAGLRLTSAYIYNDQFYTEYTESISRTGPNLTSTFDRAGNKIPGVAPHEITARLSYDEPAGPFKGLGAFVEYQWRDAFYMDNGNILEAPAAETVNLNVHYNREIDMGPFRSLSTYFEVRNVFDETYIASANNIANSLDATGAQNGASVLETTSGTIYAGAPRTYYGGLKLKF
ncbi:MAG: TonB-dependent receptor [Hyphomicrobium sp.]|jgi:iron complex outermembrane receptor protein